MRVRVYIDSSVIGGCYDEEFAEWSNNLLDEFISGAKIAVLSDLTLRELEDAPPNVQDVLNKIPVEFKEYVILYEEAKDLAVCYVDEKALGKKSMVDAQHIAIATIEKVDVLVSWNFKHIVNLNKIHLYNGINLKMGYQLLEIRTPREVLYEKDI